MKHQVRWMKSTRFSRPKGHFGTALTFSMPFGLLALGRGGVARASMVGAGAVRLWAWPRGWRSRSRSGALVVRDRSWFGLLVLYPIRDLMGFCFWAASYAGRRILWRGHVFELLPGGRMRAAK